LHIPVNGLSFFKDKQNNFVFKELEVNVENYLIQKAREETLNCESKKVIKELEEEEWLSRTNWPICINSHNNLNPLSDLLYLNEKELQLSDLIKKITEDNFINQELGSLTFNLESKKQEVFIGEEKEVNFDNFNLSFMPNTEKENKFVFIASKLISLEGIRKIQILEKELEIKDIKPEKLTLVSKFPSSSIISFTLKIFLHSGKVKHIIVENFVTGNNNNIRTVFDF
jgi:hypothetical protein